MNWTSLQAKAFTLPKMLLKKRRKKPHAEFFFLQNVYLTRDYYGDYIKHLHLKNKKANSLIFNGQNISNLTLSNTQECHKIDIEQKK